VASVSLRRRGLPAPFARRRGRGATERRTAGGGADLCRIPGPANLRLTGALADGWIGNSFLCESAGVFFDEIAAGAAPAGRSIEDLDLTVAVSCEFTDDVDLAGRRHAAGYAFTFGAMGSAATNFYNRAFERQGFGESSC